MQYRLMVVVIVVMGVLMFGGLFTAVGAAEPAGTQVAQASGDDVGIAELKARIEQLETKIPPDKIPLLGGRGGIADRLRFQGDLRLRNELDVNRNFVDGDDRWRQRMRLRFGLTAQITNELTAGFRMGSGNPNQVNTAEVNFGNEFSRKTFLNLDQAYLRYKPTEWATTTGGKFGQPWWRPSLGNFTAEIVWDNDVQPEGLVQQFNFKNVGPFSELGLTGGLLIVDQFDEAQPFNRGNLMFGGQALAALPVGEHGKAKFGTAFYSFENPDSIAKGNLQAREGPLGNQTNKLRGPLADDGTGRIGKCNTGSSAACSFVSDFEILEINGQYDLNIPGWLPIGFFFDYAKNLGAKSSEAFGQDVGKENDAFQVYATVGKLRKPGDWLVGYGYAVIEADAAIGQFNSDDLQYTNTKTQTIFLEYQVQKNVSLIWDSYLQERENELLSGFQGNSSLDQDKPLRVKTRVNILVKF